VRGGIVFNLAGCLVAIITNIIGGLLRIIIGLVITLSGGMFFFSPYFSLFSIPHCIFSRPSRIQSTVDSCLFFTMIFFNPFPLFILHSNLFIQSFKSSSEPCSQSSNVSLVSPSPPCNPLWVLVLTLFWVSEPLLHSLRMSSMSSCASPSSLVLLTPCLLFLLLSSPASLP
jgi:hypothetical protein